MAAAAFGGGARRAFGESEADGRSETSSKRRKTAYKEAFPVRGVTCVGCAIATRITPVERFVKENIGRMTETALWKMAALCYKKDVAEPCEREGVVVPGERPISNSNCRPSNNLEIRSHTLPFAPCVAQK